MIIRNETLEACPNCNIILDGFGTCVNCSPREHAENFLCKCSCGDKCPLGKTGMEGRCQISDIGEKFLTTWYKVTLDIVTGFHPWW